METKTDADKIEVELKKAITALGEETSKLAFRAPTAADIMQVGNPVSLHFSADGEKIDFDAARMGNMMALLGNIPPSSVKQMAPRDFVNCCWSLRNFFLPE